MINKHLVHLFWQKKLNLIQIPFFEVDTNTHVVKPCSFKTTVELTVKTLFTFANREMQQQ